MRHWQDNRGLALTVALAALAGLAVAGCRGGEEAAPPSPADRRIEALSQELELDDEQRLHLENTRDLVHERRDEMRAEREARFAELTESIEAGAVDRDRVHGLIDTKAEQLRATAHQVADELIALVESMDQSQRERLVERLEEMHDRMRAFHERMESGGGHHRAIARCLAEQGFSAPGWFPSEE